MQTTLRINDDVYRRAKTEAAREGITLTRFIEEALLLRMSHADLRAPTAPLPTFRNGPSLPESFDLLEAIRAAEAESDTRSVKRLAPQA